MAAAGLDELEFGADVRQMCSDGPEGDPEVLRDLLRR